MESDDKIKVIIVDDSFVMRRVITEVLEKENDIKIIATAENPIIARDEIVYKKPDVVILDVEMPEMNGISFLKILMKHYPIPVIIFSSLTKEGSNIAIDAYENGAFEVLTKPDGNNANEIFQKLIFTIRRAYINKNKFVRLRERIFTRKKIFFDSNRNNFKDKYILIGSSTGGTEALKRIIPKLPQNFPPVLIVQHMPPKFTTSFAKRLNEISSLKVKEAEDGEKIERGKVLLAPGDYHMIVREGNNNNFYVRLNQGPKLFFQRPAVEWLFKSGAKVFKDKAVGVLLTGMGKDGAEGLSDIKKAGGITIVQSKESSVVWGMAGTAVSLGVVDYIEDLEDIAGKLIQLLAKNTRS